MPVRAGNVDTRPSPSKASIGSGHRGHSGLRTRRGLVGREGGRQGHRSLYPRTGRRRQQIPLCPRSAGVRQREAIWAQQPLVGGLVGQRRRLMAPHRVPQPNGTSRNHQRAAVAESRGEGRPRSHQGAPAAQAPGRNPCQHQRRDLHVSRSSQGAPGQRRVRLHRGARGAAHQTGFHRPAGGLRAPRER